MYRDKDLLNLAQGEECLLNISSRCLTIEGSTTVACHDNSLQSGKGMALKADDSRSVWGCYWCHTLLDQGNMEYEERQRAFHDGYIRQVQEWLKIATNPCLRPWKVQAARKVLDHIGVPYE
ncbi:DUF1364 family protein [bacterium]|jgi:hypothetical protein|nr:DUF1364 family protein [bacterium]